MPFPEGARVARADTSPHPLRPRRHALTLLAILLATVAAGCDGNGKPLEPDAPNVDPNLLPASARSAHFVIERDGGQYASSPTFVLIREEARHAPL